MERPAISLLLNQIRRQAETEEDGTSYARKTAKDAGFINEACEMLALVVNWREHQATFEYNCRQVLYNGQAPLFWRARAAGHLGAISQDPPERLSFFRKAVELAQSLPEGDRTYIENKACAGRMDTVGQPLDMGKLILVVNWMISWGTFDAPGRGDALVKLLISQQHREEASALARRILEREARGSVCYSHRQRARLIETLTRENLT